MTERGPMHDIRAIRADPAGFDAALARRGLAPVSPEILAQDTRAARRADRAAGEAGARNAIVARDRGRASEPVPTRRRWKPRRRRCAARWRGWRSRRPRWTRRSSALLEGLPNVLDPDVPDGPDETANVVLKQHGEPRDLGFQPKQHFELGEALGMMDFAAGGEACRARASSCCAGRWRGWSGRWASSCSTCTRASMAIPRWWCRRW